LCEGVTLVTGATVTDLLMADTVRHCGTLLLAKKKKKGEHTLLTPVLVTVVRERPLRPHYCHCEPPPDNTATFPGLFARRDGLTTGGVPF